MVEVALFYKMHHDHFYNTETAQSDFLLQHILNCIFVDDGRIAN